MDGPRRIALGMGVAGAILLITMAVAGAFAPQMALIWAVAVCGAMTLVGRGTATHR